MNTFTRKLSKSTVQSLQIIMWGIFMSIGSVIATLIGHVFFIILLLLTGASGRSSVSFFLNAVWLLIPVVPIFGGFLFYRIVRRRIENQLHQALVISFLLLFIAMTIFTIFESSVLIILGIDHRILWLETKRKIFPWIPWM